MIPSGVQVFVGLTPIDLRWGFDRLAGVVSEQLGHSARSGALFVFYGKRKTALKVLYYDGSGMCLFYKRLDRHCFRVPLGLTPDARVVTLSERELDALLDGIDVEPPDDRPRGSRRPRVH